MRKAVRVESNRKAILLVGATGILRLLTLAVSRGLGKAQSFHPHYCDLCTDWSQANV